MREVGECDVLVRFRIVSNALPSLALPSIEIVSLAACACHLVLQLDQRDKWRETPVHKAARSGNAGIVKALCTARMKVWINVPLRDMVEFLRTYM